MLVHMRRSAKAVLTATIILAGVVAVSPLRADPGGENTRYWAGPSGNYIEVHCAHRVMMFRSETAGLDRALLSYSATHSTRGAAFLVSDTRNSLAVGNYTSCYI